MQVFAGHDGDNGNGGGGVTCGAFSSCGKHLLTGGGDGTFRIWNCKNGNARAIIKNGQGVKFTNGQVNCFHQSGDIVAIGGSDGLVPVVHIPTKKAVGTPMDHNSEAGEMSSVECLKFKDSFLAVGGVDGNLKIFEVGVGSSDAAGLLRSTSNHVNGGVTCIEWQRNVAAGDRLIFSACADGKLRLWDCRLAMGVCLKVYRGHTDMILCLDLSEDGRVLVSGADDHKILVWDA